MKIVLLPPIPTSGRANTEAAISFIVVVATLGLAVVCGLMLAPLLHWY
jgi:hypothetical protein